MHCVFNSVCKVCLRIRAKYLYTYSSHWHLAMMVVMLFVCFGCISHDGCRQKTNSNSLTDITHSEIETKHVNLFLFNSASFFIGYIFFFFIKFYIHSFGLCDHSVFDAHYHSRNSARAREMWLICRADIQTAMWFHLHDACVYLVNFGPQIKRNETKYCGAQIHLIESKPV